MDKFERVDVEIEFSYTLFFAVLQWISVVSVSQEVKIDLKTCRSSYSERLHRLHNLLLCCIFYRNVI